MFASPSHPYTRQLLEAVPVLPARDVQMQQIMLAVSCRPLLRRPHQPITSFANGTPLPATIADSLA
ncbi:hypothetical protein [Bosea sp. Root670]|uniref:hypothetical protein n=1 Tax=Bosea sp. Root670 TaxID=1736583 RepID=UPI00190FCE67